VKDNLATRQHDSVPAGVNLYKNSSYTFTRHDFRDTNLVYANYKNPLVVAQFK